jgi:hypothetical protein
MTDLEPVLKSLLQRDVSFEVNNKALRAGKLIIFHIKDFYISFILKTEKHPHKLYEIPVPYKFGSSKDGDVMFDYRLRGVDRNDKSIQYLITTICKQIGKKSKFFDNTLTIKIKKID